MKKGIIGLLFIGFFLLNINTMIALANESVSTSIIYQSDIDEITILSLTASSIQLDLMTSYNIDINNKIPNSRYFWICDNPKVVKVNHKNGKIEALKEGKAIVTCIITFPDTTKKRLNVEVNVDYNEYLPSLTRNKLYLDIGEKHNINVNNKIIGSEYQWISSDEDILRVDTFYGDVKAKNSGEVYITCTIITPSNDVIVLLCDIIISIPIFRFNYI